MKTNKILIFIMLILIIFSIVLKSTYVNAGFIDNVIEAADGFVSEGGGGEIQQNGDFKNGINELYVTLLIIAIIAATIVGGILGLQFIMASAEDKAKVKEALIPYIVGCIVAFGAFGIWKIAILVLS